MLQCTHTFHRLLVKHESVLLWRDPANAIKFSNQLTLNYKIILSGSQRNWVVLVKKIWSVKGPMKGAHGWPNILLCLESCLTSGKRRGLVLQLQGTEFCQQPCDLERRPRAPKTNQPSWHFDFSLVRSWAKNLIRPCPGFWLQKLGGNKRGFGDFPGGSVVKSLP